MKKIRWNSPVVLSFACISALVLLLDTLTKGWTTQTFFSVYREAGGLTDPLFYVRLFGHVLGHANLSHYTNNMMIFLLVGPLLEEKYGSKRFLTIIAITAVVTGIVHLIFGGNTALLGASGVDFACILLASITGTNDGIPLTLIVVAIIYISQQIYTGLTVQDNISQLTHIVGGAVGAFIGLAIRPKKS